MYSFSVAAACAAAAVPEGAPPEGAPLVAPAARSAEQAAAAVLNDFCKDAASCADRGLASGSEAPVREGGREGGVW